MSDQPVSETRQNEGTVEIDVNLTTEDFLKVYAFALILVAAKRVIRSVNGEAFDVF